MRSLAGLAFLICVGHGDHYAPPGPDLRGLLLFTLQLPASATEPLQRDSLLMARAKLQDM